MLEFLNRVLDWCVNVSATQSFVGDTVNEEAIEVFAQAIHDNTVAILHVHTADIDRTWAHPNQIVNIAAIQGQVGNLLGCHPINYYIGAYQLRIARVVDHSV